MQLTYSVFGLGLCTNLPIPGLNLSACYGEPDVEIFLQALPPASDRLFTEGEEVWFVSPYKNARGLPDLVTWKLAGGSYYRLSYGDGMEFILNRTGTRIWATWPDTLTVDDAAVYLLGPVLGFVLRIRGVTCLHASAVCVGDSAIALLGPAGSGKSTTAAGFRLAGYPVLSDDVVTLLEEGDAFLVQPSYPCLRLWPAAVEMLFGEPDFLPRLVPTDPIWDKRYLSLADESEFRSEPLPLAAIYLLAERSENPAAPFVDSIPACEGLIELVSNAYPYYLTDIMLRAKEFKLLSRVVQKVPVRRVTPSTNPALLPELCDVIAEDYLCLPRKTELAFG